MGFDLVPDASAPVRKVSQAQATERCFRGLGKRDIVTQRPDIVEQGVDHLIEDFVRHVRTDEIKDDYVLSDTIQYLRPVEYGFEVLVDLASNLSFHRIERLVRRDVGDALARWTRRIDSKIGSEHDEG